MGDREQGTEDSGRGRYDVETAEMEVSTVETAGAARRRGVEPVGRAGRTRAGNTEKSESVHQKVAKRFERVQLAVAGGQWSVRRLGKWGSLAGPRGREIEQGG